MITKNQIKLIASLHQKKHRLLNQLFIAEGEKCIKELLDCQFEIEYLFETENIFFDLKSEKKVTISASDLQKISALTNANNCLAVFKIPQQTKIFQAGLILVLDDVRDPGNLGTIIRLCDWFNVSQLVCSQETVDLFNPKVVQATMGSLGRVNVVYCDLTFFLSNTKLPIYGTFMNGKNIYTQKAEEKAIIVMGNEANGISKPIEKLIQNKISIPRFGSIQKTESLNVATATAIFLSEFKRGFEF
jgi:RNA methyltransferase, TrmH family